VSSFIEFPPLSITSREIYVNGQRTDERTTGKPTVLGGGIKLADRNLNLLDKSTYLLTYLTLIPLTSILNVEVQ